MIFVLQRTETRNTNNVNFYQFSKEEEEIYKNIDYFIEKTEELSEDGFVLTKKFKYRIDHVYERLQEIYNNKNLHKINENVNDYCIKNNITRGELQGKIVYDDGSSLDFMTFPEID